MISRVEHETKRKRANWSGVLLMREIQTKKTKTKKLLQLFVLSGPTRQRLGVCNVTAVSGCAC
jgi:hypothetical protein